MSGAPDPNPVLSSISWLLLTGPKPTVETLLIEDEEIEDDDEREGDEDNDEDTDEETELELVAGLD